MHCQLKKKFVNGKVEMKCARHNIFFGTKRESAAEKCATLCRKECAMRERGAGWCV
jgi:hypothetical protein